MWVTGNYRITFRFEHENVHVSGLSGLSLKISIMNRQMKPVHPGEILREDILKEMNLTITVAAQGLGVSRKHLSAILNEQVSITAEMAVRLEQAFGVEAGFWLDLQKKYDIWKVQKEGKIHVARIRA